MSLNPVSARLLNLIEQQPGRSGKAYLLQIADELKAKDPDIIVEHGLTTLQDFRDRDIITGTTGVTEPT